LKKRTSASDLSDSVTSIDLRIPYYKKPQKLTVDEWQWKLRKQFGEDNEFVISNIGQQAIFSDYLVYNPDTINNYKVAIRDFDCKHNFCSCLDFKTNRLGICKHIAAVLKRIELNNDLLSVREKVFIGPYSSIILIIREEDK